MKININEAVSYLEFLFSDGKTSSVPALRGESGVGKTAICKQVADRLGFSFHLIPVSHLDIGELGMPVNDPNSEYAEFSISSAFKLGPNDPPRIILLDEWNRPSSDAVANFMMALISERSLYGEKIDDRILFVATLNPSDTGDYIDTRDMFSDLAQLRRINVIDIAFDVDLLIEYFRKRGVDAKLIDYLIQHPSDALVRGDINSPRLWENFSSDVLKRKAADWNADNVPLMKMMASLYMSPGSAQNWTKFWVNALEQYIKPADILKATKKTMSKLKDQVDQKRMDMIEATNKALAIYIKESDPKKLNLKNFHKYLLTIPSAQALSLLSVLIDEDDYPSASVLKVRMLEPDMDPLVKLMS